MAFVFGLALTGGTAYASTATTTPIGNGDHMLVTNVWGLTGYETPKVSVGATVIDEAGNADVCPAWYPKHMGCFDITRTDYYRNAMIETVRQIQSYGFAVPQQWVYWLQFVR